MGSDSNPDVTFASICALVTNSSRAAGTTDMATRCRHGRSSGLCGENGADKLPGGGQLIALKAALVENPLKTPEPI